MELFVIYKNPADFPDLIVVRSWQVTAAGPVACSEPHSLNTSMEDARASIPGGFVRFERDHTDDPCIAEVWI